MLAKQRLQPQARGHKPESEPEPKPNPNPNPGSALNSNAIHTAFTTDQRRGLLRYFRSRDAPRRGNPTHNPPTPRCRLLLLLEALIDAVLNCVCVCVRTLNAHFCTCTQRPTPCPCSCYQHHPTLSLALNGTLSVLQVQFTIFHCRI